MPFLVVNGITFPADSATGNRKPSIIGDRKRAYLGSMRSSQTVIKRTWDVSLKPAIQSDADAYEGLIQGLGHSWSFDVDLYSDKKGLGKKAQTGTVTPAVAGGKFGNKVQIAALSNVTWAAGLPTTSYTVMVWRLETAVWHHYVVRKNGGTTNKWKDGASNDGVATTWLTVNGSGDVVLGDVAVGPDDFDDLVALPYVIPSSWPAAIFAAGVAWQPLPELGVSGTMTSLATVPCLGMVQEEPPEPFPVAGVWQVGGRRLQFTLEEV